VSKIFLPEWFNERSFEQGERDQRWWGWCTDNLWSQGIETWDIASFGRSLSPDSREWLCAACHTDRVRLLRMADIVDHLNSEEHEEKVTLYKLSGGETNGNQR